MSRVSMEVLDAYIMHTYGALAAVLLHEEDKKRKRRKRRTCWIRPWLTRRLLYGQFEQLLVELEVEDVASFRNFLRVSPLYNHCSPSNMYACIFLHGEL